MAYPRRSSRSPRSRFTFALLLLSAVTLLVLDLPGTGPLDPVRSAFAALFRPVRSAGDVVFRPITNGWKGAFDYGDVKKENGKLRDELSQRKSDAAKLAIYERRVKTLEAAAGIDAGDVPTKEVEVTSGPLGDFDHTIQVDTRGDKAVHSGMVVIAGGTSRSAVGGQVLGRITRIEGSTATVELLTDPTFAVGIRLKDRTLATAQGQGRGKDLVADGISSATTVKRGDAVFTSGLNQSPFPANLEVGRVAKVSRSSTGNTRTIEIRPTVDLNSEIVRICLKVASG